MAPSDYDHVFLGLKPMHLQSALYSAHSVPSTQPVNLGMDSISQNMTATDHLSRPVVKDRPFGDPFFVNPQQYLAQTQQRRQSAYDDGGDLSNEGEYSGQTRSFERNRGQDSYRGGRGYSSYEGAQNSSRGTRGGGGGYGQIQRVGPAYGGNGRGASDVGRGGYSTRGYSNRGMDRSSYGGQGIRNFRARLTQLKICDQWKDAGFRLVKFLYYLENR